MTSKSKSNSMPWREPKERRRMFLYLPLHIFEAYTNIRDLISKENPSNIHIKQTTKIYYNLMRETQDWSTSLLKRLDFILPPGKIEKHASIWHMDKAERDTIFQQGYLYNKQMIYLPLHIFATATNAKQILVDEAHKRNLKNFEKTDDWIEEMHDQLHKIDDWQEYMKKLAFKKKNDVVLNDIQESVVASTSRHRTSTQIASSSGKNAQVDPVPSTSSADSSKRSEMVKNPKNIFSNKPNQTPMKNPVDMNELQNIRQSNDTIEEASNAESQCSEKEQTSSYIRDNEISTVDPDGISSIALSEEHLLEPTVEPRNTNLNSHVHVAVAPSEQSTSSSENDQSALRLKNIISKICKRNEPTEFQKRVMDMNYETFVNQTNITELAIQAADEHFNASREFIQMILDGVVRKHYEMRTDFEHWHEVLLNCLKFKQVDKNTQADDRDVQLNPMDRNSNEIVVVKTGQTNTPPSLQQTKMAKLSIHEITSSQIIHSQFVVVPSSQDNKAITDDDAYITNVQSSSAVIDDTVFVSQESPAAAPPMSQQVISVADVRKSKCIEHTPQQIEPQLAQNPIGTLAPPEDMIEKMQEHEMNAVLVEDGNEAVPSTSSSCFTKTPEQNETAIFIETAHVPSSEAVIMEPKSPEPTCNLNDSDVEYVPNEPDEIIVVLDDSDEHSYDLSRQQSIITLADGLPTIEVSDSPPMNSPFRNIVNISVLSNRPSVIKRTNPNTEVAAAKKRKIHATPSNQLNQVTQGNANLAHAEQAVSLPEPGST